MGYFSDNAMALLPGLYSLSGKKRIRRVTSAAGNTGDDTFVAGGMFLGAENDTYTVTVTTGGAPPACAITVTSVRGDGLGEVTVPLFGIPVRISPLGLSAKFIDGGDGVLTGGNSWEIEVTAGDLHDFRAISALGFDRIEALIDGMAHLVDVDTIPDVYLAYLGALIDYDYDWTRDAEVQRKEIKNLILSYRMRGTKPGILRALRLAGYKAEIYEPYTRTFQLGTEGRGFQDGIKLSDEKYSHCTFEVQLREVCRDLWDILWDQVPRGKRMFAVHEIHGRSMIPGHAIGYVTGDSQFSGGWGRFPVRLFKVVTQFETIKIQQQDC
ncbi:MAG: phage tail protein [Chlamydiota bacterium]